MHSTEATTLDRKSGEADLSRRAVGGSAVPQTFLEMFFDPSVAQRRYVRASDEESSIIVSDSAELISQPLSLVLDGCPMFA
jgi:hypothetical protein